LNIWALSKWALVDNENTNANITDGMEDFILVLISSITAKQDVSIQKEGLFFDLKLTF